MTYKLGNITLSDKEMRCMRHQVEKERNLYNIAAFMPAILFAFALLAIIGEAVPLGILCILLGVAALWLNELKSHHSPLFETGLKLKIYRRVLQGAKKR